MKKLLTLFVTLVPVVLVGCGGNGTASGGGGLVDYSGTWAGSFSGDLTGNLSVVIERSGTMDISGTANGIGSFSGEGWINPNNGTISGDLGSLGRFSGSVRLSGASLVGEANLAKSQTITFRLNRQ